MKKKWLKTTPYYSLGTAERVRGEVLDTDLSTILNFDSNQVFNQYNNKSATANGVVQNQQIIAEQGLEDFFKSLKDDITFLKTEINNIKNNK